MLNPWTKDVMTGISCQLGCILPPILNLTKAFNYSCISCTFLIVKLVKLNFTKEFRKIRGTINTKLGAFTKLEKKPDDTKLLIS